MLEKDLIPFIPLKIIKYDFEDKATLNPGRL
jgi:hypothetical protein